MKRTREQVRKWAIEAIDLVNSRCCPVYVTDATVVGRNADGRWWVADNGEEVGGLTAGQAVDVIVENLTAK